MRTCPICTKQYDDGGNSWKRVCYDCYKNYRLLVVFGNKRIKPIGYKDNIYISHPSVTKEEVDEYIKRVLPNDRGWGAQEWIPENWDKFKIWTDNINFD